MAKKVVNREALSKELNDKLYELDPNYDIDEKTHAHIRLKLDGEWRDRYVSGQDVVKYLDDRSWPSYQLVGIEKFGGLYDVLLTDKNGLSIKKCITNITMDRAKMEAPSIAASIPKKFKCGVMIVPTEVSEVEDALAVLVMSNQFGEI